MRERIVLGGLGTAVTVAGVVGVFRTETEAGTSALLLVGGLFLVCAAFGSVPTTFQFGDMKVVAQVAAYER